VITSNGSSTGATFRLTIPRLIRVVAPGGFRVQRRGRPLPRVPRLRVCGIPIAASESARRGEIFHGSLTLFRKVGVDTYLRPTRKRLMEGIGQREALVIDFSTAASTAPVEARAPTVIRTPPSA
jgi:hypothetical protein